MKKTMIVLLVFAICLMTGCTTVQLKKATNGHLDLSDAPMSDNHIYKMRGNWKIVWHQFLDPNNDTEKLDRIETTTSVPITWSSCTIGDETIGSQGFGTLVLDLDTPKALVDFAIETTYISSAFDIYADGELIASNGQVGRSSDTMIAKWKPVVGKFQAKDSTTRIVIHFSNFNHRRFVIKDFYIGTNDAIDKHMSMRIAFDLITVGGILIMGVYHLLFYLLRKQEKTSMYFSFMCLTFALRSVMVGSRYIYNIVPNLNWDIFMRAAYIEFYIAGLFLILFVSSTFSKHRSKRFDTFFVAATLLICTLTLFLSPKIFDLFLMPFEIILFMGIIYIFGIVIKASKQSEIGSRAVLIGLIAFICSGINDMAYEAGLIGSTSLSPYGLLIVIISQSFMLAQRYTHAYRTAEALLEENSVINAKLNQHNVLLEDLIAQRTHELNEVNEELQTSNEELVDLVEAINRSETHFRSLFHNVPIGIFRYSNLEGFTMVNPKLAEILGFESAHVLHKSLNTKTYRMLDDNSEWIQFLSKLTNPTPRQVVHHLEMIKLNGDKIIAEVTYRIVEQDPQEIFTEGTITDISKKIEMSNQLKQMAETDPLTGLYNRRMFSMKMNTLSTDALLCIIDIDDFKNINDTYGHDAGDIVLVRTAEILRTSFHDRAFISRIGGEEFAIIFEGTTCEDATHAVETLRKSVEACQINHRSEHIRFTISAGLSNNTSQDLFREADILLYEAKTKGKNQIASFEKTSAG